MPRTKVDAESATARASLPPQDLLRSGALEAASTTEDTDVSDVPESEDERRKLRAVAMARNRGRFGEVAGGGTSSASV